MFRQQILEYDLSKDISKRKRKVKIFVKASVFSKGKSDQVYIKSTLVWFRSVSINPFLRLISTIFLDMQMIKLCNDENSKKVVLPKQVSFYLFEYELIIFFLENDFIIFLFCFLHSKKPTQYIISQNRLVYPICAILRLLQLYLQQKENLLVFNKERFHLQLSYIQCFLKYKHVNISDI